MPIVLQVVLRGVVSFATLLILARALGKQQLGQLSFFEYITGITIGSMAASLTVDLRETGWIHWAGLVTWAALAFLVQMLALKNRRVAKALTGEPDVVIMRGQILEENLRRNRYRFDELLSQLRRQGIFDVDEVEFAVLETSGQLSVLPRGRGAATRAQLPWVVAQEGEVLYENLRAAGRDEVWLRTQLAARGIGSLAEVTVAIVKPDGNLYVDTYDNPPATKPH